MSRWQVTEKGVEDPWAVTGLAAPSWGNFTRRVWERETPTNRHRLVLRNLSNDWGYKVPERGSEYQVRLFDGDGKTLLVLTGTNWQALVDQAKDWSVTQEPG